MTLVLLENGVVLEGSSPKIDDKQVPGIYTWAADLVLEASIPKNKAVRKNLDPSPFDLTFPGLQTQVNPKEQILCIKKNAIYLPKKDMASIHSRPVSFANILSTVSTKKPAGVLPQSE